MKSIWRLKIVHKIKSEREIMAVKANKQTNHTEKKTIMTLWLHIDRFGFKIWPKHVNISVSSTKKPDQLYVINVS